MDLPFPPLKQISPAGYVIGGQNGWCPFVSLYNLKKGTLTTQHPLHPVGILSTQAPGAGGGPLGTTGAAAAPGLRGGGEWRQADARTCLASGSGSGRFGNGPACLETTLVLRRKGIRLFEHTLNMSDQLLFLLAVDNAANSCFFCRTMLLLVKPARIGHVTCSIPFAVPRRA